MCPVIIAMVVSVVHVTVVTAILSLSGEEETQRKDSKALGMVKLRGEMTCDK